MEQYTGVGKPPYCEMTLRADADGSTPPDLTLPVTLTGVKQSTTIILERMAQQSYEDIWKESSLSSEQETGKLVCLIHMCCFIFIADTYDSTKYMCQVFYHKEGTNHWTVTVTFLPSSKQRLVSEYYSMECFMSTSDSIARTEHHIILSKCYYWPSYRFSVQERIQCFSQSWC